MISFLFGHWKILAFAAVAITLSGIGFAGKQYLENKEERERQLLQQLADQDHAKKQLEEHYASKSVEAEYLKETVAVFDGLIRELNSDLVDIDEERQAIKESFDEVQIVKNFKWFVEHHPDDLNNLLGNIVNSMYKEREAKTRSEGSLQKDKDTLSAPATP